MKIILAFFLFTGMGLIAILQSCKVTNNDPTVPLPVPTSTFTPTPTNTPTNTPTATSTSTPVICSTHVVLSVSSGATPVPIAGHYTYVDQFTLAVNSNPDAVTVTVNSASATGTGNFVEIGFYNDNGSNYPGSVIFTSDAKDFSSTGISTYIFKPGFSLVAGNYWLAIHTSVAYQPNQNSTNSPSNYLVSGRFPNPFPAGASSLDLPWSYFMDTCHP